MQFQGPFKVPQGTALLVQIIIGIPHTEVPRISFAQFFLKWPHQFQCPVKQFPSPRFTGVRQIIVRPGQLHIHVRGAFLHGDGFQGIYYLLMFISFMPLLALL